MKVALVYDRVNKFGGAERLLGVLHEMFPTAPLYSAVYNKATASWADTIAVKTTFLQAIPFAKTNHEFVAPFEPVAFENFNFDTFDLVISITSEYAKGILTKPKTLHICYCLTPTRYLWSGYSDYFSTQTKRTLSAPLVSYLRTWDKIAAQRPDFYIAISKTVQKRIKKYYGRESVVIYPPITLLGDKAKIATPRQGGARNDKGKDGFFLIVSRLVPYKRIDIAIEAFNKLGWKFMIIGSGREYAKLAQMAGPTIEFLQNLTDGQLIRYYQECSALIYPAEEDFGLAMLEAQSFGKPVIAFGQGGAQETIIAGKTGEFFYPQSTQALTDVLKTFKRKRYSQEACIQNAQRFSKERFKKDFMNTIDQFLKAYK